MTKFFYIIVYILIVFYENIIEELFFLVQPKALILMSDHQILENLALLL